LEENRWRAKSAAIDADQAAKSRALLVSASSANFGAHDSLSVNHFFSSKKPNGHRA
jgi:hypothetical protein